MSIGTRLIALRYLALASAFVLGVAALPAAGQTGARLMVQPFADGRTVELGSELTFINNTQVEGVGGGDLDIYDAWGRWRVTGAEERNVTVGFDVTYLDITAPRAAVAAGTTLTRLVDQSVAVGFTAGEFDGWQVDAAAGIGHAGSVPYSDGQALYAMGDVILTRALDDGASVQLFLNYDGNRAVLPDLPLPGIAYHDRVNDTLSYTAGLPFSALTWQPDEQVRVDVAYGVPTTFNVRAAWQVRPEVSLFAAMENRLDAFAVADDRPNRRVFFKQSRAEAGVLWTPGAAFKVEVAGGYAFEQRFSRGFDVKDDDTIATISDEPYVKVAVGVAF